MFWLECALDLLIQRRNGKREQELRQADYLVCTAFALIHIHVVGW